MPCSWDHSRPAFIGEQNAGTKSLKAIVENGGQHLDRTVLVENLQPPAAALRNCGEKGGVNYIAARRGVHYRVHCQNFLLRRSV
jgi:hypothetical protein